MPVRRRAKIVSPYGHAGDGDCGAAFTAAPLTSRYDTLVNVNTTGRTHAPVAYRIHETVASPPGMDMHEHYFSSMLHEI